MQNTAKQNAVRNMDGGHQQVSGNVRLLQKKTNSTGQSWNVACGSIFGVNGQLAPNCSVLLAG